MKYISRTELVFITLVLIFIFLFGYSSPGTAAKYETEYWPSSLCRSCHSHIFTQYSKSMHAKSFTNPVFQEQYFKELLPQIPKDSDLIREAKGCIACHSPIAYIKNKGYILSKDEVNPEISGVTCDICHTITGYKGEKPENGNYISKPGTQKYGPFPYIEMEWHHFYAEFQTKSEFCAVCHNAVNHHGLEIKSTYTEWKSSNYAKEGIQCQNCHMNIFGFLVSGKPVYESGRAALTTPQYLPHRAKLYTHRFPGAHDKTQVIGALTLDIETDRPAASPGDKLIINVLVDNSRTGHKMPSGSADLRLLWLELKAYVGKDIIRSIPINASPDYEQDSAYNVTGKGAFDDQILRDDIPKGNRIYRAIFVDKTGKQTLSSYNATKIIFDNRLNAEEIRKETYHFNIPKDVTGKLFLYATLYYLPYPDTFAKKFALPESEALEIAFAKKEIVLH